MLRIEKWVANHGLADVLLRRAATLTLIYEQRCRSRLAVRLDDGREAGLFLPRATVLRHGDVLVADEGSLVRVVAAPQAVLRIVDADPLLRTRAAYHLGNRHTPVQIEAEWLQLEHDAVLRNMLLRLGATVVSLQAPFDPEPGAYGGGHRHGHDATFAEDHALAQQVFAQRHGAPAAGDDAPHDAGTARLRHAHGEGDHPHAHDHPHDHVHERNHRY